MERRLRSNEVLWPSRLKRSGATVLVKTKNSLYQFKFEENNITVSGGAIGPKPVPAQIHGISFISSALYMDRIMTYSTLIFNQFHTSTVKSVTIKTSKKILKWAIGKWPEEHGGPSNPLP